MIRAIVVICARIEPSRKYALIFSSRDPICLGVILVSITLLVRPARAQDALFESCRQVDVPAHVDNPRVRFIIEPELRNLCGQVVTTMARVQPVLGIVFSGGNPVLGTASALGSRSGVPRISVTGRVNVAVAEVPDLIDHNVGRLTDDTQAIQALETSRYPVPSVQVDLAMGVLDGFSITPLIGGVGAIDLLGSLSFVPAVRDFGLQDVVLNVGGGVRVGLIEGGALVPGVSISGMYRRLSDITFGDMQQGDAAQVRTNLNTWSARAVVSKGLPMLDLAAGAGIDRYSGDVEFGWALDCSIDECLDANGGQPLIVSGNAVGRLNTTAWTLFGNVGVNLALLKIVGEVGYQRLTDPHRLDPHIDVQTGRLLDDELGGGNIFTSLGLRLAL